MKLGILVNTEDHAEDVIGITKAAVEKGHEVIIFTMDVGTRLLERQDFVDLHKLNGVSMSFCDHSAQYAGAKVDNLPDEVPGGTQYNNAVMNQDADKVIVL